MNNKGHERSLIVEVGKGDELAFRQLLQPYTDNLYTTFMRMTGEGPVAEELLQDALLKVWLKREDLPGIDNFGGWLYRVAANIGYNYLDSSRRTRSKAAQFVRNTLSAGLPATSSPEDLALEKEYSQLLQRAIDRLTPKQKQTYQLIREEGMRRDEAARQLGVSPETVKWNLDQAMRNIRAYCMAHSDILSAIIILLNL